MEHKRITANLELKNIEDNGTFEGYASVFDVEDSDGDVIAKGAFAETMKDFATKGKLPKMLWQHDPRIIIGKFTSMLEDENGLFVKGELITDVEKGREAYALLKAGALDAMSVGFNINEASPRKSGGRLINSLDLWEVSLVTWGANPDALISDVKSDIKSIKSERSFERFLRDSGFSKRDATAIACKGYKTAMGQSDSESLEIENINQLIKSMRV